jgi:hypothetical protein
MHPAVVVVVGLLLVAAAGEPTCSCESQINGLEAEVAALRRSAVSLDDVRRLVREELAAAIPATQTTAVDSSGSTSTPSPTHPARRLSSANPTHVSVVSRHVHEFPNGHTCGTVTGYMEYLPVKADDSVSWSPSPSDVIDRYSFGTVSSDWSQTRLQDFAAPIKILHDLDCAAEPTLQLPLSTIASTLTATSLTVGSGSIDVAAALTVGTWQDVTLHSSSWQFRNERMQYLVHNSVVYLKGGIEGGGGNLNNGDIVATIPSGARPAELGSYAASGVDGDWIAILIRPNGDVEIKGSSATTNVFVNGISYPCTPCS